MDLSARNVSSPADWRGVAIASTVLLTWGGCLTALLLTPLGSWAFVWVPLAILVQAFLFTGLFITAHDAMHGTVAPGRPRTNAVFGYLSTALYASFSYEALRRAHWKHHDHPGSDTDPDYHADVGRGAIGWYFGFMREYVRIGQLLLQGVVFWLLVGLSGQPTNVVLFWAIPSLLSTTQLFFVGTYLPHRPSENGFSDHHNARTLHLPPWLSFLACYHFGYHLEHHRHPHVPWWRLHTVKA